MISAESSIHEAGNVRDVLEYYSAAPERNFGRQIPVAGGIDITFKEPLGVVGVIAGWNFPMPIAGWAMEPALAAGNTAVLKPAELTPLTAMRLAELAVQAGQIMAGCAAQVKPRRSTTPGRTAALAPGCWSSNPCSTSSWRCSNRRCAGFGPVTRSANRRVPGIGVLADDCFEERREASRDGSRAASDVEQPPTAIKPQVVPERIS